MYISEHLIVFYYNSRALVFLLIIFFFQKITFPKFTFVKCEFFIYLRISRDLLCSCNFFKNKNNDSYLTSMHSVHIKFWWFPYEFVVELFLICWKFFGVFFFKLFFFTWVFLLLNNYNRSFLTLRSNHKCYILLLSNCFFIFTIPGLVIYDNLRYVLIRSL